MHAVQSTVKRPANCSFLLNVQYTLEGIVIIIYCMPAKTIPIPIRWRSSKIGCLILIRIKVAFESTISNALKIVTVGIHNLLLL